MKGAIEQRIVVVNLCCPYTRAILLDVLYNARDKFIIIHEDTDTCKIISSVKAADISFPFLQFSDFESIDWDPVLAGQSRASSYLVRKGLSRKAQFSIQLKKFTCKNKTSILHRAIPYTLVLDVWSAFEDMKFDFGGGKVSTIVSD